MEFIRRWKYGGGDSWFGMNQCSFEVTLLFLISNFSSKSEKNYYKCKWQKRIWAALVYFCRTRLLERIHRLEYLWWIWFFALDTGYKKSWICVIFREEFFRIFSQLPMGSWLKNEKNLSCRSCFNMSTKILNIQCFQCLLFWRYSYISNMKNNNCYVLLRYYYVFTYKI